MSKSKSSIAVAVTLIVTIFLAYVTAFGIGDKKIGAASDIKLGLDLAGGVSITYEATDKNPDQKDMDDTVYKLQKRAETYSTEAEVYQEGDNRITIEIPGVTDADAVLEELGKPGSLEFFVASATSGQAAEVVLEGSEVKDAQAEITKSSSTGAKEYVVQLTLTSEGAEKFGKATEANIGKQIMIAYDDDVICSPTVKSAIYDGNPTITGMESYEAAEELASYIRIGGLSLELEKIRSNVVGAKLGDEALKTSLIAGAIGLALVIIFMCVMFRVPGVVSSIALILYTVLELVVLNAFDVTLTLPGIAGIILSIGMAVDANVIIFVRIREEIGAGKSVKTAIRTGFSKALSAIVDGNVTTLIAALVLGLKGSGSVKGFAQTLAIGIILSMFTALVISRLLINAFYVLGAKSEKLYGKQGERKVIDFVGKKFVYLIISGVLIVAGFVAMGVYAGKGDKALNYSLEFMGGDTTQITFNDKLSDDEITNNLIPIFEDVTGDANVQKQRVEDSNDVIIKTRELSEEERATLNDKIIEKYGIDTSAIQSESISSTVSNEMKQDAIVSVIIAAICMLIYIWFRFKDIRFATCSVIPLIHDVLVVLTFYAVARISVGNTFIACMLTIVGYSINATIVVFDRIRESMGGSKNKENLAQVVNESITQTLTRSVYTSLTTFVMVLLLWILGVSSIREFAAPLMVGIVSGCYSSVCIAGTMWYLMKKGGSKKTAKARK